MKTYHEMAESILTRRDRYVLMRKRNIKRITAAVSCICLCAALGVGVWQSGILERGVEGELKQTEQYVYRVEGSVFSSYIGGKVIDADKIGDKLADVTVHAGWQDASSGEWLRTETLRAEVYAIEGISGEVAVALRFLEAGEAVTAAHYYVLLNPAADLSGVAEYRITPSPSVGGELAAE